MVDSLDSLRHHIVVGSHNNDSHIGHLRTTGTHSGKRLVTRCIQERNLLAACESNVISTNMLGYTTRFTSNDIGITNIVEQRSFTMVNVSHDSNNRRTADQIFRFVFLFLNSLSHFGRNIFSSEAELAGNQVNGFSIETLVDRHHLTELHAFRDNLNNRNIHHAGDIAYSNELRYTQDASFLNLFLFLFAALFSSLFTLIVTVFSRILVRHLLGEEFSLSLTHIFVSATHQVFIRQRLTMLVLMFTRTRSVASLFVVVRRLEVLNIDTFLLADTLALATFVPIAVTTILLVTAITLVIITRMVKTSIAFAFFLLLRLFLRTSLLV